MAIITRLLKKVFPAVLLPADVISLFKASKA